MSADRVLLAKSRSRLYPNGEPLTDHSLATLHAAVVLRDRVGRIADVPDRFWSWVLLAALLHDPGKAAEGSQRMLQGGANWGERHEVLSLGFAARVLEAIPADDLRWIALGIVTHHRPLTGPLPRALIPLYGEDSAEELAARMGKIDEDECRNLLAWLAETAHAAGLVSAPPVEIEAAGLAEAAHSVFASLADRWELKRCTSDEGLTAVLLQGAVTLADHLSSAHSELLIDQPVDNRLASDIRQKYTLWAHQEQAAAVLGHLLLLAPTGAGKTEALKLWATAQVEDLRRICSGQPRVFYTLPYLASINAMVGRFGRLIGQDKIGVAHSRAASYHLGHSIHDPETRSDAAQAAVSRQAATRLFREPVRIGTPYQLLRGAIGGPAHSGILVDSANSVFVLDELHAYDARRFGMILAMTSFWARIGGRIAVASATLPEPVIGLLKEALGSIHILEARHESWPSRHRLQVRTPHLTDDETIADIARRLDEGESVLVVANNVADARYLYEKLGPLARELHGDDAAILLHARFKTGDRSQIEQRILHRYEAGKPHAPGLLIATQVVEVSLNVDFDTIYTSGASLEPLLQRFGRTNRLGERPPADVIVCTPAYRPRNKNQADLYADGVYETEPTRLAMDILTRNSEKNISESDAATWLDEIYSSPWGQRWQQEVTKARDDFAELFLGFTRPYDDRRKLAKQFDEMFDGTDAIVSQDVNNYKDALNAADGAAGRLLGAEYLIPLPPSAARNARYDKGLGVWVIDAEYYSETGLGGQTFRPGEVP